jgi:hypothetical protein
MGGGVIAPIFLTSAQDGGEWSVLPPGKSPRYSLDRRLGGPQSQSGLHGEEKTHALLGIEPGPSSP